ncbi:MAG TPA: response regulator [Methanothrix sp.]|nr:response regulator [Methanothrix sp.]HPC88970.1 response regulator [Methanothrix sp.]HQE86736.1 response regulator [Methanothrix sp.]HQI68958.1 response regulator [Methanothrix sp.]HRS84600.1 response regulator [Methanothrix sp.]
MERELRIMLIEDDLLDAAAARRLLRHNALDRDLVIAADGRQAVSILQNSAPADLPQLILLDINLPDMSGIELLKNIKKEDKFKDIPVVILTGSNEDKDIQKSYDLGAKSYLVKPISNEAFLLVLKTLFS